MNDDTLDYLDEYDTRYVDGLKAENERLHQERDALRQRLRYYDSVVYQDTNHLLAVEGSNETVVAVDPERVGDIIRKMEGLRERAEKAEAACANVFSVSRLALLRLENYLRGVPPDGGLGGVINMVKKLSAQNEVLGAPLLAYVKALEGVRDWNTLARERGATKEDYHQLDLLLAAAKEAKRV